MKRRIGGLEAFKQKLFTIENEALKALALEAWRALEFLSPWILWSPWVRTLRPRPPSAPMPSMLPFQRPLKSLCFCSISYCHTKSRPMSDLTNTNVSYVPLAADAHGTCMSESADMFIADKLPCGLPPGYK